MGFEMAVLTIEARAEAARTVEDFLVYSGLFINFIDLILLVIMDKICQKWIGKISKAKG